MLSWKPNTTKKKTTTTIYRNFCKFVFFFFHISTHPLLAFASFWEVRVGTFGQNADFMVLSEGTRKMKLGEIFSLYSKHYSCYETLKQFLC